MCSPFLPPSPQAAKAKQIADDAQRDLDEALPALERALESLKNLSRNDIVEVKALQNPPAGVKLVMEATCIMFDEKPKMKDDPNNVGKKVRAAAGRGTFLHQKGRKASHAARTPHTPYLAGCLPACLPGWLPACLPANMAGRVQLAANA